MTSEEIIDWLTDIHEQDGSTMDDIEIRTDIDPGLLIEFKAEGNPIADDTQERTSLTFEDEKYRSIHYGEVKKNGMTIIFHDLLGNYGQYVDLATEHTTTMWLGTPEDAPAARVLLRNEYEQFIASEVAMDIQRLTDRIAVVESRNLKGYARDTLTSETKS